MASSGSTTFNVGIRTRESTETFVDLVMGADDVRQMFIDRGATLTGTTTISIFAFTPTGGKKFVMEVPADELNTLLFTAKTTSVITSGPIPGPDPEPL